MDWEQYVALAKHLAGDREEASERSAVSRAYYGAFNLSRRWVEANVASVDNLRAHKKVWDTFKFGARATQETSDKWELVGVLGNSLRLRRNEADYADEIPDLECVALKAVESAERIVALLEELEVAG